MGQNKQIFLAFAIPMFSALVLFLVRVNVFPNYSHVRVGTESEPLLSPSNVPFVVVDIVEYLVIGLLILSLILPFFVSNFE